MNRTLLSTIVFVTAVAIFTGCGPKRDARPEAAQNLPAVAVRTQTVGSKQWPSTEEVVGTVRARLRATIEAKVSGRIAGMPVALGQKVSKGQILARLLLPSFQGCTLASCLERQLNVRC